MSTMVAIRHDKNEWNEREQFDALNLGNPGGDEGEREALVALLDAAAARIANDPDAALVLLDGLLPRMLVCWLARQGYPRVARVGLLDAVAEVDPVLAYRARLALRAPDVYGRLAACQQLYAACFGEFGAAVARAAGM